MKKEKPFVKDNVSRKDFHEEVEKSIKVAVVPFEYPDVALDAEQMNQIQNFVLAKIDLRTEGLKPSFNSCNIEQDYLVFDCYSTNTKKWLAKTLLEESPLEDVRLKVISLSELTTFTEASILIPDRDTDAMMALKRIENQNERLKTGAWKLLHSHVDEKGLTIFVNIDMRSLQKIKSSEFKLGYKFTRVNVELLGPDPLKLLESSGNIEILETLNFFIFEDCFPEVKKISTTSTTGKIVCFKCQKEGHYAKKCPMNRIPATEIVRFEHRTCNLCGKAGHISKNCESKSNSSVVCFKCGLVGHFARKCKKMEPGESSSAK